jgi:HAD superfamily hydrolase (TIGR01509 family)
MPSTASARIEALILDLFGVVLAFDDSLVCERIARQCRDPDLAFAQLTDVVSQPCLIRGELTIEALHARLVAEQGLSSTRAEFIHIWRRSYSEPMPGMRDLLRRLHGQCRLVLLSNVDGCYWPTVADALPELGEFHARLLSFEQGVAKPQPEAFRRAIDATGTAVEHCLFVDGKPENIDAAAALGLRGHVFQDARRLELALRQAGLAL